jgi:hypothetical protein
MLRLHMFPTLDDEVLQVARRAELPSLLARAAGAQACGILRTRGVHDEEYVAELNPAAAAECKRMDVVLKASPFGQTPS